MAVNERIEKMAESIFNEYNNKIPVNPIIISEDLDISVLQGNFKNDIDGALVKKDDEWSIYIEINQAPTRKRFTIAHELGHYYLHQNDAPKNAMIVDYRSNFLSNGGHTREAEANAFAAALLMNRDVVKEKWEEYESIPYLANCFGVSNDAMRYRLKNLELLSHD